MAGQKFLIKVNQMQLNRQSKLITLLAVAASFTAVSANLAFAKDEPDEKVEKTEVVRKSKFVVDENGKKVTREFKYSFKSDIPIKCVKPNAECSESKKVIKTLMKISDAYSHGDFETFGKYLDEDITILDKKTKKIIAGKEAVLNDVKSRWKKAHTGPKPVLSYTIEHPYAKVMGDQAVVTFKAIKVVDDEGKKRKYVSKSTDIFVKKNGEWKKLHYISDWKKVKS